METHADAGEGDDAFALDDPGDRPPKKRRKKAAAPSWPQVDPIDYRQGLTGETRVKENLLLSKGCIAALEQARMHFTMTRQSWMLEHGAMPGLSAFREGLLRLGLKHLNDPELFALIPPDARRRKAAPAELPDVKPVPAATAGDLPEIPAVDHLIAFDAPRTKESVTMPESLLMAFERAMLSWSMVHPEWLFAHGTLPGKAGIREGLLRLGLKHFNDPELAELIPGDQRRRA